MKEKIIKKSEELFLTLGFRNVTMDDIATGLGISKKTIYAHFSNKTELVSAVTFSVLEYIYKGIEQIKKNAINTIIIIVFILPNASSTYKVSCFAIC